MKSTNEGDAHADKKDPTDVRDARRKLLEHYYKCRSINPLTRNVEVVDG